MPSTPAAMRPVAATRPPVGRTPVPAAPKKPAQPVLYDPADMPQSVFAGLSAKLYSYVYDVEIHVGQLVGGTPTDPRVIEGWMRTKLGLTKDEQVHAAVEEVMNRRGVTAEEAAKQVARNRSLSGFKRDFNSKLAKVLQAQAADTGVRVLNDDNQLELRTFTPEEAVETFGELHVEGRHLKAMLKEAVSIGVAAGHIDARKWGMTNKGALSFFAEHAFVPERTILLGVTDPTAVVQSFVHTWQGSAIKLEEVAEHAVLSFTLKADYDFDGRQKDFWGTVFSIGQENGLGASRSQGYGTFRVTRFDRVQ